MLSEIDSYTDFTEYFRNYQIKHGSQIIEKVSPCCFNEPRNEHRPYRYGKKKNITPKQLRDTERLWFSTTNIYNANNRIIKFIQDLPLPTIFNDHNNMIHTSSDGKKSSLPLILYWQITRINTMARNRVLR